MKRKPFTGILSAAVALLTLGAPISQSANAEPLTGTPATYTLDEHFEQGTSINLSHDPHDQLQLDDTVTPFNFIWVAASARGTIIKIDTTTGAILGEYWSSPDGRARNPSRTTVDANGNVWSGNRAEADGGRGSAVHIGLVENGQCVDRNDNGVIDTSTGLGDIKDWKNTGGVDDNGGVATAEDECIIHYIRTAATGVRTMAIDANNDIWIGGTGNRVHELYDGDTGLAIAGTQFFLGCGGYGGLMDGNGVLWSASASGTLLRYDTTTSSGSCIPVSFSYGLGIDTNGVIWLSNWTFNTVTKIAPSGAILGTFTTLGASGDRGVAVTPADNNVWIANSAGADVSRLDNSGAVLAIINVGTTPTGVAVDGDGYVWVTNLNGNSAMRIDPNTNLVDLTVDLGAGAGPYNYSDMTGSTLIAPPDQGTWEVIHDTEIDGVEWGIVSWTADEPGDSSIVVEVSSSDDGSTFSDTEIAVNGADLSVPDGRWLKVTVRFTRSTDVDADDDGILDSPILYDLTLAALKPFKHGKMHGHGELEMDDDFEIHHEFKLHCDIAMTPNWLEITWGEDDHHHSMRRDDDDRHHDRHRRNRFRLQSMGEAICVDDPSIDPYPPAASFDRHSGLGKGTLNGEPGYLVHWRFTDAGEPGEDRDFAGYTITGPDGSIVLSASGLLDDGNQNARDLYSSMDDDDDDDDHHDRDD